MNYRSMNVEDDLKKDAKTLSDISRILESDGRFAVLPQILEGIAADIWRAVEKE